MPSIFDFFKEAIKNDDVSFVRACLKAHPEWLTRDGNGTTPSPLSMAAMHGALNVIRFLITEWNEDPNRVDHYRTQSGSYSYVTHDHTALIRAIDAKKKEAVALLLELGADPTNGDNCAQRTSDPEISALISDARNAWTPERSLIAEQTSLRVAAVRKAAGTWTLSGPQEITHEHPTASGEYALTDVFNFATRTWTTLASRKDAFSHKVVFFDDMPDKSILEDALAHAPEGHGIDPNSIHRRSLPGKTRAKATLTS